MATHEFVPGGELGPWGELRPLRVIVQPIVLPWGAEGEHNLPTLYIEGWMDYVGPRDEFCPLVKDCRLGVKILCQPIGVTFRP
jgi:hypothetical protein